MMFEPLSTLARPTPRPRRAGAVMVSVTLGVWGAFGVVWWAGRVQVEELESGPVVALVEASPAPPPPLPLAPRPGPPGPVGTPEAPEAPQPAGPPSDALAMVEVVEQASGSADQKVARGGGSGGGAGDGGGGGGGGVPVVTADASTFRHRTFPEVPPRAWRAGEASATCELELDVSAAGVPEAVHVSGCAKEFQEVLRKAAVDWRVVPVESGGRPVRGRIRTSVTFRAR